MKPHLRVKHGIWSCYATLAMSFGLCGVAGYGYTPSDAYLDWKRELRKTQERAHV